MTEGPSLQLCCQGLAVQSYSKTPVWLCTRTRQKAAGPQGDGRQKPSPLPQGQRRARQRQPCTLPDDRSARLERGFARFQATVSMLALHLWQTPPKWSLQCSWTLVKTSTWGSGLNIEVLRVGERMMHAAMSGNMLGQKITLYTMTIAD